MISGETNLLNVPLKNLPSFVFNYTMLKIKITPIKIGVIFIS